MNLSTKVYDIGDMVRVTASFANIDSVPTDPTTIVLLILTPDGIETVYTYGVGAVVVRSGAGEFHADILAELSGKHEYRWQGTGIVQAAEEGQFYVKETRFTNI